MTRITIAKIEDNTTVSFAVDELYDYLKKIDHTLFVDVRSYSAYDEAIDRVIWVGESDAFADKLFNGKGNGYGCTGGYQNGVLKAFGAQNHAHVKSAVGRNSGW